jgi:predicted nucleic acid-binding protein
MYDVTPATSAYVVGEVRKNVKSEAQSARFEALLARMLLVSDGPLEAIPSGIEVVRKDQAVLASAISASMDYLLTGDIKHFGKLYGTSVSYVKILSPGEFRRQFSYRLIL